MRQSKLFLPHKFHMPLESLVMKNDQCIFIQVFYMYKFFVTYPDGVIC